MKLKKFIFICTALITISTLNIPTFANELNENTKSITTTNNNIILNLSNCEIGQTIYINGVEAIINDIQIKDNNTRADSKDVEVVITYKNVKWNYDPPNKTYYTKKYLLSEYAGWLYYDGNASWQSYQDGTALGTMKADYSGTIYKQ